MKTVFAGALALLLPFAAAAQSVETCDWRASAANLAEPWEENTRTFANGAVRVALVDTLEPAAGAYYVLVIAPPYDELGLPQCRLIGYGGGMGFSGMTFDAMDSGYDPSVGLILSLPAQRYNADMADFEGGVLSFAVNQATGEILTGFEAAVE